MRDQFLLSAVLDAIWNMSSLALVRRAMTPSATISALHAARADLEKRWVGRTPIGPDECCLVTAVSAAVTYYNASYWETTDLLRVAIGLPRVRSLLIWNDQPGRTKAEVLAAIDKAIELACSRGA